MKTIHTICVQIYIYQVGSSVFKTFCDKEQSHWIDLKKNFRDQKKRQFSTENVDMEFPVALERCFEDVANQKLSDILNKNEYFSAILPRDGNIRIYRKRMVMFFDEAVSKINDHIKKLLAVQQLGDVTTILLVGGFSESKMVSDGAKHHFKNMKVIAPPSASLAILKGAVMYGRNTNVIASRVSPYSYGVHTRARFNCNKHQQSK